MINILSILLLIKINMDLSLLCIVDLVLALHYKVLDFCGPC
jgi:hypothetical protein